MTPLKEEGHTVDPLVVEKAVGGEYRMPDGRAFWIDAPVAREIARRVVAALLRALRPEGEESK